MGGVLSAIRQVEILGPGAGSLAAVRTWWLEPVNGCSSLQDLCGSSVAAKRLEEGLNDASHAYNPDSHGYSREFQELFERYLKFACACVSNTSRCSDFAKPIWLDWIDQTAEALRVWRGQISAMAGRRLREEFETMAWEAGIAQIQAGRSRVAHRIWRECAQRVLDAAKTKSLALQLATKDFQLAVDLAAIIGVAAPSAPTPFDDDGELRRFLDRWWTEIADPAIDQLYWDAQLPFLSRARNQPLRQLTPNEKKALTQLIESANHGGRPAFNEVHKLSLTHAAAFDEILATRGHDRGGRR
jgi:hypothetical protein